MQFLSFHSDGYCFQEGEYLLANPNLAPKNELRITVFLIGSCNIIVELHRVDSLSRPSLTSTLIDLKARSHQVIIITNLLQTGF